MAPRRKAARIEAPATLNAAITLITEYLDCASLVDECRFDADQAIRLIEARRDEVVAPIEQHMKDLFIRLRTWWAVARPQLTEGKRKSIDLAGAIIGDRIGTPALKLPRGMKVDEAIDIIDNLVARFEGAEALLRTKVELDKPALIKLLGNATAVGPLVEALRSAGFTTHQREEFFIDRSGPKEADPVIEQVAEAVVS